MSKKSKGDKRDRSNLTPSTSPSTSPAQKAPRGENTAMGSTIDVSAQLREMEERMRTMEEANGELQQRVKVLEANDRQQTQRIATLEGELAAATKQNNDLEEENEKLRRSMNRTKLCLKDIPAATSNEEVKAKILELSDGLPAHGLVEVYTSGPSRIAVFTTVPNAVKALKAQGKLYKAKKWRMDRALTRQQRQARAAQGDRYLQLKEQGAFPRFHGTTLMVKMTTGIKPATDWDPALKLPPRPANRTNGQPPTYAAAAAGGPNGQQRGHQQETNGASTSRAANP